MPDGADDHTKYRRRSRDPTGWPHDVITKDKMDTRIHHENEPSKRLRATF